MDPAYLSGNEINFVEKSLNSVKLYDKKHISYRELASEIREKSNDKVKGGLSYNAFTGNAYLEYENQISEAKQTLTSQYYAIHTKEKQLYSLTLENGAYFSDVYQDHYNPRFLQQLDLLEKNSDYSNYQNFFESYGTHVIIGGIYGRGSMDFTAYIPRQEALRLMYKIRLVRE